MRRLLGLVAEMQRRPTLSGATYEIEIPRYTVSQIDGDTQRRHTDNGDQRSVRLGHASRVLVSFAAWHGMDGMDGMGKVDLESATT